MRCGVGWTSALWRGCPATRSRYTAGADKQPKVGGRLSKQKWILRRSFFSVSSPIISLIDGNAPVDSWSVCCFPTGLWVLRGRDSNSFICLSKHLLSTDCVRNWGRCLNNYKNCNNNIRIIAAHTS